jgi:ABC-2 type transport system permease protein
MYDASKVYAIALKDLKEAFSSISIYGPMLAIPLIFSIALPIFTFYVSKYAAPGILSSIVGISISSMPYNIGNLYFIRFFALNILGPIFLTMPIITASVIAADSFAGEKERKTAESLLLTPTSNFELLAGKILASLIPALVLTVAIFLIYASIINYMAMRDFGVYLFPNASWYLMLLNAPFLALTTIGLVVLVSAKVKGVKEAQQISTLLILPILVIPFISIFNIASLTVWFFLGMLCILIATSLLILYLSVKSFNRESFISL